MDRNGDNHALKAVECEINENKIAIGKVECKIIDIEVAIEKLEAELSDLDAQIKSRSARPSQQLRKEKERKLTWREQLTAKELELRAKERQLRKEKEQLREKERQLRGEGPGRYLQRALLMTTPSRTSLKREQLDPSGGALIKNWRPDPETAGGLLPELIHPVFAKAVQSLSEGTTVDRATIEVASKLCCIGAAFYDNEAGLTSAIGALLSPYLEYGKVVTIGSGFAANNVSPNWALGDSSKDPSNLFLIVEAKPGIGGSGDPHFQGANYLLHFWRQRAESDTFRNTCCPAFLLEVVGPHVRLSAVAWLDRVTIFPLTPLLNLLPVHPVTDRLLMPVAHLLATLRVGVHELAAAQQPAAPNKYLPLPWPIGMNPRYDAAAVLQLAPRNPTYYVRLAVSSGVGSSGGSGGGVVEVAVKLCRKYGLEAHQAWADLGLAPRILRVEPLPGGWQLVEMEWLPGPEWRQLSDLLGAELDQALAAVRAALESAHGATGMVHGDVRPPNCLVRCDAGSGWHVRFVDFEWAGREGESTYPCFLNPDVPWPEGVGYKNLLQRAHDFQLLAASTASHGVGKPGVARSLSTAARERCATALHRVAGGGLHRRGVWAGWRQSAAKFRYW